MEDISIQCLVWAWPVVEAEASECGRRAGAGPEAELAIREGHDHRVGVCRSIVGLGGAEHALRRRL